MIWRGACGVPVYKLHIVKEKKYLCCKRNFHFIVYNKFVYFSHCGTKSALDNLTLKVNSRKCYGTLTVTCSINIIYLNFLGRPNIKINIPFQSSCWMLCIHICGSCVEKTRKWCNLLQMFDTFILNIGCCDENWRCGELLYKWLYSKGRSVLEENCIVTHTYDIWASDLTVILSGKQYCFFFGFVNFL